jgi:tripartite-type tricarboxylate transporter receptor subunit TctC
MLQRSHGKPLGRRSVLAAAAVLAAPSIARAQSFPTRPIRLLIPWAPGGTTDVVCRVLSQVATRELGQTIVVENRGGAGGVLAAQQLAAGVRPDGYTLAQSHMGTVRQSFMRRSLSYDPVTDFTYIIRLCGYLFGMAVRANSPWRDWAGFVAHARANPDKLTFGSSGVGSDGHVFTQELLNKEGLRLTHVPYRGVADALTALLAGQVDCVGDGSAWAPGVEAGDFRLLNVWTEQRVPRFPDVPTARDLGYDFVATAPFGISGPKGMDPGVVKVLHDALKTALHDPAHRAAMARFDLPLAYLNSADYAAFMRDQSANERLLVERLSLHTE